MPTVLRYIYLKGLGEFQNRKILDRFSTSFYVKYGNFKTQDFSPLIERVVAGVTQFRAIYVS